MKTIRNFVSALLSVALFAVVLTAVVVAVPAQANNSPLERGGGEADGVWSPQPQSADPSPKGFLTDINVTADAKSEYGYTPGSWDPGFLSMINTNYNEDYKTEETALVIDTAAELASFSKAVNSGLTFEDRFVSLGQNIDLEGIAPTITKDRVLPDLDGEPEFEVNITGHAYNVWEPIGFSYYHLGMPSGYTTNSFNGIFDGRGFEIRNMVVLKSTPDIDAEGRLYTGLFGYVGEYEVGDDTRVGSLKNVGVVDSVVVSHRFFNDGNAGVLVGYSDGNIANSYATGDVYSFSPIKYNAFSHAGGLVGSSPSSSSITNSYATGNIYSLGAKFFSSNSYAGGLVGQSYSSITNSYATGNIYSSAFATSSDCDSYAGGLVGQSYSSITNSYATGNIYSLARHSSKAPTYSSAGGLAGESYSSITNSYATGAVYSYSSSSDSDSDYDSYSSYAGGLVGYSFSSSITNSYSAAQSITAIGYKNYIGGLVGRSSSSITNSYSTAKAIAAVGTGDDAAEYIGGLVGQHDDGEINQSYFDSTIAHYYGGGSANHDGLPESTGNLQSGNQPGLNTKPWTHPSGAYPTLDIIPAFETSYAPTYNIADPIPDAQVTKGLSDLAPEYFIVDESPANFVAEIDRFTGEVTVLGPGTFKILALRVGGSEFQSQDVSVVSGTITISGDGPTPPPPPPPVDTVPVFRVFNPLSGEHHYTRDRNESETLIANGWNNEGTAWVSPKTGAPVYRVFNPESGEHHYTKDHNEFQTLVDRGWKDEGISWHSGGTVPVQRVFNPRSGEHHYTKDRNESKTLIAAGWTDEGTAWMAVS